MAAPPGWWGVGTPWACWRAEQEAARLPSLAPLSSFVSRVPSAGVTASPACPSQALAGPSGNSRHTCPLTSRTSGCTIRVWPRDSHRGEACISCSRLCGRLQAPSGAPLPTCTALFSGSSLPSAPGQERWRSDPSPLINPSDQSLPTTWGGLSWPLTRGILIFVHLFSPLLHLPPTSPDHQTPPDVAPKSG